MNVEFLISARVVLADSQTIIADGAVAIGGGKILDIGPRGQVRRRWSGAKEYALAEHLLLPGLINVHTHLELSHLAGKIAAPAHFTDWVLELWDAAPPRERLPEVVAAAVRAGAEESIRYGVTTVGDISRHCAISRMALSGGLLRVVSFGEIMALGRSRGLLETRLASAAELHAQSDFLNIGLSPHAPYSVEGPALKRIVQAAEELHLPLAMHLAELSEERQFLATLDGPLGPTWELMRRLQLLDNQIPRFADGPIAWAEHYGLLAAKTPVVLAHVNYADDGELDRLARSRAGVAYCPRTRHYFGHDRVGRHRWRDMRARGIKVCLATDSLASNPDLSVLREAQFVWRNNSAVDPRELFAMLTTSPAEALGMKSRIGRLATDFLADMAAVKMPADIRLSATALLAHLFATAPLPEYVWINGRMALGLRGETNPHR